jgi:hypothetical protein
LEQFTSKGKDMNDDDDFGFTAIDYDPIADADTVTNMQDKLKAVENLILPLLQNLQKNPEKPTIHWPNRKETIQKQIDKILAITRS